jgi:iron-sulfur cluster assembly protein
MAVTLTETAAHRVRHFISKRGKGEGLRLGVRRTGCSGWAYVVDIADGIEAGDNVFEDQGVKVVINEKSLAFLNGTEIDFGKEGLGETFKFNNPNVKDECGCGESFNI